jgi:hypothetical protein
MRAQYYKYARSYMMTFIFRTARQRENSAFATPSSAATTAQNAPGSEGNAAASSGSASSEGFDRRTTGSGASG